MPRDLPAHPSIDHLKNEAKALRRAHARGDADALVRVAAAIGPRAALKLIDAQRVLAREYGFTTWARLRAHVLAARGADEAVAAFLAAVENRDAAGALEVLRTQPSIAGTSLHVAAVLGQAADVQRLIALDPAQVSTRIGAAAADPLLWLCYSPFHGENAARDAGLLAAARALLDAGADPNTRDARHGVPALYAVTGFNNAPPIARLLLDAGAEPNDGESAFHAAEQFHEEALELLLAYGVDLNATGDWGNTPLYFLLRYWDVARMPRVRQGLLWLLDHGADPNVPCGREQETSLHVAARRAQHPDIVKLLLARGADVHARRGDGRTAWSLARRAGFDTIASLLEEHGASPQPLSPPDVLLAACGRGDADAARRLATHDLVASLQQEELLMLPHAAAEGRLHVVQACLAAGFPVDTPDDDGATALHVAAIHGHADIVRALILHGASLQSRDPQHDSRPLGWAFFGADYIAEPDGDYPATVALMLEAGARPAPDEQVAHDGVRQVLLRYLR